MKNPFRRAPEDMNADDLQKYLNELFQRRRELKAEMEKVSAILESHIALSRAAKKLDGMTDVEKRALAQRLRAEGIDSQESFGLPS